MTPSPGQGHKVVEVVEVNDASKHGRYEKVVERLAVSVQGLSICHPRRPARRPGLITLIHMDDKD